MMECAECGQKQKQLLFCNLCASFVCADCMSPNNDYCVIHDNSQSQSRLKKFRNILQKHPLVHPHDITAVDTSDLYYIGWKDGESKFEINIIDDICYILFIQLKKEERGMGHGELLYKLIADAAKELGCKEVRQRPSGTTPNGKSRKQYLLDRGWVEDGNEVVIEC